MPTVIWPSIMLSNVQTTVADPISIGMAGPIWRRLTMNGRAGD